MDAKIKCNRRNGKMQLSKMAEWKQFRSGLLPFTLQVSRNTHVTVKVAVYPPKA